MCEDDIDKVSDEIRTVINFTNKKMKITYNNLNLLSEKNWWPTGVLHT